jgi:non-heme chloroperoxidase
VNVRFLQSGRSRETARTRSLCPLLADSSRALTVNMHADAYPEGERILNIAGNSRWLAIVLAVLGVVFGFCGNAYAGGYVRVSPDLEIYYEEAGSGAPIVFIPGWTATTEYMRQQIDHFSERYRAIVYDPRSQGRSSKTLENNNYTQHGADLRALMEALGLEDVVLVGHSTGCKDAYAYFRAYGTDNVKAFVCIDEPPKPIIESEGDWGSIKAPADLRAEHDSIIYDRLIWAHDFQQSMVTRPLTEEENNWLVDVSMKTPTYVAISLFFDAAMADYTAEAKMIDGTIPVLNVLSDLEGWSEQGTAWLAENAPNSEVEVFGLHLMFWEFPDRFNAVIDAFLETVQ